MKVLSANQIRKADAYTIKHEPISSIDLMERAAQVCVEWLVAQFEKTFAFTVVCGPGSIEQAHKVDEYVSHEQLKECLKLLIQINDFAKN